MLALLLQETCAPHTGSGAGAYSAVDAGTAAGDPRACTAAGNWCSTSAGACARAVLVLVLLMLLLALITLVLLLALVLYLALALLLTLMLALMLALVLVLLLALLSCWPQQTAPAVVQALELA